MFCGAHALRKSTGVRGVEPEDIETLRRGGWGCSPLAAPGGQKAPSIILSKKPGANHAAAAGVTLSVSPGLFISIIIRDRVLSGSGVLVQGFLEFEWVRALVQVGSDWVPNR